MSLQSILNGPISLTLARFLARSFSPEKGYALGEWLADRIAGQKKASIVRTIRANQWVIHQENISQEELAHAVRETLREGARCIYTYFHFFEDSKAILDRVEFSPSFLDVFNEAQTSSRGALWVSPHLSNFDIVGKALALRGLQFQVLSYPSPGRGYVQQNNLRARAGIEVTPFSPSALRTARIRLSQGGLVLTGIDRPLPDPKYRPAFFGRPSAAPVAYIRLALQANVPVIVVAIQATAQDRYLVSASPPIEMVPYPDNDSEFMKNAENVLAIAETFIRQTPYQWLMYYPVWPEVLLEKLF